MDITPVVLEGKRVCLEPLRQEHFAALAKIAFDADIWRWMPTWIATEAELQTWIETALMQQRAGLCLPWATREKSSGRIVGSTRFSDIQAAHGTLELGHSWLIRECQGTGLNVEAKYLQLRHAFESMGVMRVGLRTHHKNLRSQAAMRAMGAKEEGTFRNHMVMPDGSVRHSVYFSVIREEWPETKAHLERRMHGFFGE